MMAPAGQHAPVQGDYPATRSAGLRGRLACCWHSLDGEDAVKDAERDERTTVAEAAERLGITKEAVRKRISRGTLRSDKDPDGTLHVYVPSSSTAVATFDRDELMAELRAIIEVLRTDRDAWRDLARRSDYMASAALDLASAALDLAREREARLRELESLQESPSDAPESPETASDAGDAGPAPRSDVFEQQEGVRRPWWRRVFGG
jgi:excisionase family DNA binding protein